MYVLQEHPLDLSRIKLPELLPHHVVGVRTTAWHLGHEKVTIRYQLRNKGAATFANPS
jgi:hypothetical protein